MPAFSKNSRIEKGSKTGSSKNYSNWISNGGGNLKSFLCHQYVGTGDCGHKGCRKHCNPVKTFFTE